MGFNSGFKGLICVTPCVKTYVKVERSFNMVKPVVMKTHPRNVQ